MNSGFAGFCKNKMSIYNRECDFYYSSVQSIAKKDLETPRTILVTSIQKLRQVVRESPQDEELIGINCDFFVL